MRTDYYRRPAILSRLEPGKGHAVIEASAGTGKTYTLEHLVLDILIRGQARIEEILVVTFTDAATRELRERVRSLIRRVCDESAELEPGVDAKDYWAIDDSIRSRLREALFRFDGAQISTIHGFCHRVLSEQAFLGGRLFEQEHADGAEMFGFAFREEARRVLVEQSGAGGALRRWIGDDQSLLKLEQFLYRCHREGCPERCPVTPEWNPEAFKDTLAGLPDTAKLKESGLAYLTDKKDCAGFEKIVDSFFETLTQVDQDNPNKAVDLLFDWAGKKTTINKRNASRFDHLWRMAEMDGAPDIIASFHRKVARMIELAAADTSFFVYELLPRVQRRLASRKRALGLFDYDDMLLGVLETLTGDEAAILIGALRKRWKFALVDEFQDTDPVQWAIFKKIFVDDTDKHYLYIIGDPKQAIYSFRGADVHTYELAKKHLTAERKAERLPLKENFRSTEALIEAVNEILTAQDDGGGSFFSGLNSYNEPVKCGDRNRVTLESGRAAVPVHLLHLYGRGDKLNADAVRKGVARFIGEEIGRLLSEKGALFTASGAGEPKPIKLSDIYILTRSASEGEMIGAVLRRFGIPHAFYKQEGLFQTTEADDLYRLLCAIDVPTDPAIRMAAWLTPFFGIELSELPAWKEAGESHPLATILHDWKRLADEQSWSKLFEAIVSESGLVRRLVFTDDERALTNYLHLFEILLAETHVRPVTLTELTRSLKGRIDGRKLPEGREGDIQRLETDREAVQILTMHKAKGLEAAVIFIAGGFGDPPVSAINMNIYHRDNRRCLHIGRAFGEIEAAVNREIDEENQRLIYVALTRAKARLYLPYFGPAPAGDNGRNSYGYSRLGRLYRELQKQLDRLREGGRFSDGNYYAIRAVDCLKGLPGEEEVEITAEGWPEEGLLVLPPSREEEVEKIKPAHCGVLLTSYTRMNRGKAWQATTADLDDGAARRDEEVAAEAEDGLAVTDPVVLPASDSGEGQDQASLPGGRETGIMLHALLDITPAEELGDREFADWAADEKVKQRVAAALRQHGFAEMFSDEALQLVYRALRTPLRVENLEGTAVLTMPGGLASGERHCPEIFFSYPIPEEFHPLLDGKVGRAACDDHPPYEALRGFLQGLIDLVFEHEKKIYLLDWKSDRLPSYKRPILADHVEKNYSLQAQVYSLAVIRLLNIGSAKEYEEKFGGILYAFVRGIGATDAGGGDTRGIWFSRPTFEIITGWEKALVKRTEWGGDVISSGASAGKAGSERGGDSGSGNWLDTHEPGRFTGRLG